ncbi:MAG: hydroxyisourate hydrolase [Specibacter sp.]
MSSLITTHILDTASGTPAAGVAVELFAGNSGTWSRIASGTTDADGRVKDLGPASLPASNYQLRFDTGAYFAASNTDTFFPEVSLTFTVRDGQAHYHVPLLLSPFSYSTYRGN